MQRRLVDLQEQRIFRSISDGAEAFSVMIGTSDPLSLDHSSYGSRVGVCLDVVHYVLLAALCSTCCIMFYLLHYVLLAALCSTCCIMFYLLHYVLLAALCSACCIMFHATSYC